MEYVGNRFACKAEADLVQLAKAKASAVVAHEGGKVCSAAAVWSVASRKGGRKVPDGRIKEKPCTHVPRYAHDMHRWAATWRWGCRTGPTPWRSISGRSARPTARPPPSPRSWRPAVSACIYILFTVRLWASVSEGVVDN